MKKVVYSVTRYRKEEMLKLSGLGYITDTDLIIACENSAPPTALQQMLKDLL